MKQKPHVCRSIVSPRLGWYEWCVYTDRTKSHRIGITGQNHLLAWWFANFISPVERK